MTADPGTRADDAARMEPTRDVGATLPDLLDVMLDKGVYLDLDLIISVADVPLIGVSLRAAVAGIETMLEHGLMRSWDEQTRQWARRSVGRHVPLGDGEEIVLRMAGGHLQAEPYRSWRPGIVYLTSRRLIVWRADPREILWQTPLEDLVAVELRPEAVVDGPDRLRVCVVVPSGRVWLSAAAPQRLHDALRETVGAREEAGDGDR
ncbi:gas vesicle protein [Promicromonospora sp. NPDC059942]|uniref:gas vesicle protein n=1 Tax=Promicromonospora sp. NPDC059942 TaxID=3347009 RepID=UPI00364B3A12